MITPVRPVPRHSAGCSSDTCLQLTPRVLLASPEVHLSIQRAPKSTTTCKVCNPTMTFKIILSGVTGRIGEHVLHRALQDTTITSVIALSRRPLPDLARQSKVNVLVLDDFQVYPDDVLTELSGADACVWCMTTTAADPLLELAYPRAFASAIAPSIADRAKRFRYLHLSGALVERDQNKMLWMKANMRKTKGQGEVQMIEVANESIYGGLWETIIARPGMVVKRSSYIGEASMWLAGSSGSFIRADELALALVDAVVHGSDDLLFPHTLLQRGQELARIQH
ncbi:hypothetical protein C7974DRAFT_164287 [Boeremia exigua]|uniref:uncharacterized protein n=1 Tax=Boeremia exigua TaxID=749465 RepID=UPI001E8DA8A2|nr:uncharacterized protein C7974DRAFT_164287 [Boeremia exigua]KAH6633075.1 hypothetical protein C7974DRAFT_164287 [Boeremia exigua]